MSQRYNLAGQVLSETNSGGALNSLCLTNGYDQLMRRTNMVLLLNGAVQVQSTNTFDAASRLSTVGDATGNTATYSYLVNSPLVSQITFKQGATTRMTTTKQYDFLNRLTSINSAIGSSAIGYSYDYNAANQRTRATLTDGSYWLYAYDALGQVISGRKYWSDGTPVAGQQFVYSFDDIGNRQNAGSGGNQYGTGLRNQQYSANTLNQYTQRTVPGYEDLTGSANSNATVSLWGSGGLYAPTSRKGEYFWGELPVNNYTGAVWLSITNFAVLTNGSNPDIKTNIAGNEFLPASPEAYGYDLDGNLTNDGRWSYTWDAENRLIKMAARVPAGPQVSLQFDYDWHGRRIRKQVWGNTTWYGAAINDLRFVYDGWNLIGELNTNSAPVCTYLWGLDLSDTAQGAGGVGGLLGVTFAGTQMTNYFVAFDGNGNVAGLLNALRGTADAQYSYGPFGELSRATGPLGNVSTPRFSTKYQDNETDLAYYGYRCYNANAGRWLSRDPIEEDAFAEMNWESVAFAFETRGENDLNLYSFIRNRPVQLIDVLGLSDTYGNQRCTKRCYPCTPPVGTKMYRTDKVPPSRPHKPFKGTHTHHYVVVQNPVTAWAGACVCKRKETGATDGVTPAPGEIAEQAVGGGGVDYFYLVDDE